jgi:PAS domain S-box-containing protein
MVKTEGFKKSEKEKKAILTSTADVIFRIDTHGSILYVNDAIEPRYGYKPNEVLGKNISLLFPVQAQQVLVDGFISTLNSWGGFDLNDAVEVQSVHRNGSGLRVELIISECVLEGALNYVIVSRDLAKRKYTEENLQAISNAVSDGIVMVNADGRISFWNLAAERIFGYSTVEALGENFAGLLVPERFRARAQAWLTQFRESGEGRFVGETNELVVLMKNGLEILVEVSISPLFANNSWNAVCTVRDITQQKKIKAELSQASQHFQALINASPIAIVSCDTRGNVTLWNKAAENTFGWRADEMIGLKAPIVPESHKQEYEMLNTRLMNGESLQGYETKRLRKDGSLFDVSIFAAPLSNSGGGVTSIISVINDVTDRNISMLALQKSKEDAEEATSLKDKFVSLLSHDLKDPLGLMIGFLNLLKNGIAVYQNAELNKMAEIAIEAGGNMNAIIHNILNSNRIKTGRMNLKPRFFSADVLASQTIKMLLPIADKKGVKIENEIPSHTRIYADQALMGHVFQNLLSNAIKFCDQGDTVKFYIVSQAGGNAFPEDATVKICVSDTGTGLEIKSESALFGGAWSGSRPGTHGEIGTGFGLPISYDIVSAHGGLLEYSPNIPKGSLFTITLSDIAPVVLFVDDDPLARNQFSIFFSRLRMKFMDAESAERALEILKTVRPHIIVIDVLMPGTDGFELLQMIKSSVLTKDIPTVLLTGDRQIETREKAFELGAEDFITKPADFNELMPRIHRLI